MSATSHGAGSGIILGLVLVLLAQQFSYLSLSDLYPSLEALILGAVVGGILGGLIGWALGRRYLSRRAAAAPAASGP